MKDKLALRPLADKIIVKRYDSEDKTPGGIVLPDTAKQRPQRGKVLAVGPGRYSQDGERVIPMCVEEGQTVLFSTYSGNEVKIGGEELLIMSESDVLAVVE